MSRDLEAALVMMVGALVIMYKTHQIVKLEEKVEALKNKVAELEKGERS